MKDKKITNEILRVNKEIIDTNRKILNTNKELVDTNKKLIGVCDIFLQEREAARREICNQNNWCEHHGFVNVLFPGADAYVSMHKNLCPFCWIEKLEKKLEENHEYRKSIEKKYGLEQR